MTTETLKRKINVNQKYAKNIPQPGSPLTTLPLANQFFNLLVAIVGACGLLK